MWWCSPSFPGWFKNSRPKPQVDSQHKRAREPHTNTDTQYVCTKTCNIMQLSQTFPNLEILRKPHKKPKGNNTNPRILSFPFSSWLKNEANDFTKPFFNKPHLHIEASVFRLQRVDLTASNDKGKKKHSSKIQWVPTGGFYVVKSLHQTPLRGSWQVL